MFLRQDRAFTGGEIAAHFEVERKAIARDLTFMRDRLGYDVRWDGSAKRYRLISAPAPAL